MINISIKMSWNLNKQSHLTLLGFNLRTRIKETEDNNSSF
jgi:hypothetical protein